MINFVDCANICSVLLEERPCIFVSRFWSFNQHKCTKRHENTGRVLDVVELSYLTISHHTWIFISLCMNNFITLLVCIFGLGLKASCT